jgi:hypothetical protein
VIGRLRLGEWVGLIAGVLLFVALFLDWFSIETGTPLVTFGTGELVEGVRGWSGLGWPIVFMLAVEIGLALAMAATTITKHPAALAVGSTVVCTAWGIVTTITLLVRLSLGQPDLGEGLPNSAVDVLAGAHLGLLLSALIPFGSWLAMGDERTDAPESAYTQPPPRPIPEA